MIVATGLMPYRYPVFLQIPYQLDTFITPTPFKMKKQTLTMLKLEPGLTPKVIYHTVHQGLICLGRGWRAVIWETLQGCIHYPGELTRVQSPQPYRQRFNWVAYWEPIHFSGADSQAQEAPWKIRGPIKNVTTFEVLITSAFSPCRQTSVGIQILIQSYLLNMELKQKEITG